MRPQQEIFWLTRRGWLVSIALIFAATCLPGIVGSQEQVAPAASQASSSKWSRLITAKELHERARNAKLRVIDARSPTEYAAGHIPGAINLPGAIWRTPPTKDPQTEGPGQRIFRQRDGSLDLARYETLLGRAGISADDEVVIYGNRAGKADGSLPAALLLKLGHERVAFLDGVGLEQWKAAGYPVSREIVQLPEARYQARPETGRLWSYQDVLQNLNNPDVVFLDSRTPQEYAGQDLRGNRRGGHIPGAKLLDSEDLLNRASGQTIPAAEAKQRIEKLIPKGKTVVVYCQSGTRCSHEELILRDLGYENVVLYDASWQEWGNRDDTPIESSSAPQKPQANDSSPRAGEKNK